MKRFIQLFLFTFLFIRLFLCPGYLKGQTVNEDSTLVKNNISDSNQVFLPISQFTYADDRRVTISGEQPRLQTEIKPVTTAIIGGVTVASVIALHIHQQNAWWSGERRSFHFEEDWVSALQVDKCGHAYGGYFFSYLMDEALKTSGVDYNSSALYGSIFGLAYQTYVETEDGFAKDWGFSPSDWYFDFIGPSFYLAQHYVPALQNITPKWQYIPTEWTTKADINRPKTFIDDYNSTTFWYSLNVNNILPDDLKKFWIPWLNIAIGYGADSDLKPNAAGPPDQQNIRRFLIGLDYDLVKLLPDGGSFWNWFRQSLNYIKLPSPAIQISNGIVKFYLMYPFLNKL
jgi:hypothetical protein